MKILIVTTMIVLTLVLASCVLPDGSVVGVDGETQFLRGTFVGCVGATVTLMQQMQVEPDSDQVGAFCSEIMRKAYEKNFYDGAQDFDITPILTPDGDVT
mgnify:FL=1